MEGSRHERTYIVATAYAIGFVTAFIAFGIVSPTVPMAQVIVIKGVDATLASVDEVKDESMMPSITQEGLFAIKDGFNRLLSVNKNSLSASAISSSEGAGFYSNVYETVVSPNGLFMYYCEQLEASDETCTPYIYSIGDDTLYPLVLGDEQYLSPIEEQSVAWTNDNLLTINGLVSADALSPWTLQAPEALDPADLPQVQ